MIHSRQMFPVGAGADSRASPDSTIGIENRLEIVVVDKRRSPRCITRFDSLVSAEREEGAGVLTEISYSGARLEETSMRPPIDSKVTLYIFVQPIAPFELTGTVLRHIDNGFVMTYELFDPAVQQLVDDVTALVAEQDSEP